MTVKRMRFLQDLLQFTGFEPGRLHLEWISAAEGPKFAQTVRDFTEKIQNMGPARLKRAPKAA
jgi:coenzyme F420-reducing hydrogenase delta subunit